MRSANLIAPYAFEVKSIADIQFENFCPVLRVMRWKGDPLKLIQPIQLCERTLLYQTIAELLEMWREHALAGQFDRQGGHLTPKGEVTPKTANQQRRPN